MTLRQRYVLQSLADGRSPKQIAHSLGLSVRTIEHLIRAIREKLGAVNVTHAIAIAFRQQLIA